MPTQIIDIPVSAAITTFTTTTTTTTGTAAILLHYIHSNRHSRSDITNIPTCKEEGVNLISDLLLWQSYPSVVFGCQQNVQEVDIAFVLYRRDRFFILKLCIKIRAV